MLKLLVAALLFLTLPAAALPSKGYTVTDLGELGILPRGKLGATAINEQGQVVGGAGQAFLWSQGKQIALGALPKGGAEDFAFSIAYSLNNRGQIVGSSGSFGPIFMSGLQYSRGFLYEHGTLRPLTRQSASFQPFAINDAGQIAGRDAYRGSFYEHGKLTRIETLSRVPVGNRSTARALNAAGIVVGWSTVGHRSVLSDAPLPFHAFLWEPKTHKLRDLGTLSGFTNSYACAVNDGGQIAGCADDGPPSQNGASGAGRVSAFVWTQGRMAVLPPLPGDTGSAAWGINSAAIIVGQSISTSGTVRACLWLNKKPVDLNTLLPADSGWTLTRASALNNKGWIVGTGTLSGKPHAYLLTPR